LVSFAQSPPPGLAIATPFSVVFRATAQVSPVVGDVAVWFTVRVQLSLLFFATFAVVGLHPASPGGPLVACLLRRVSRCASCAFRVRTHRVLFFL
jgi:hypothetical protein